MSGETIGLIMAGLLLLGLFMGHPLAFVLGGTAVLGAFIAGKPMVLGIVINRIFGDVLDNYVLIAIPLFVLMARFLSRSTFIPEGGELNQAQRWYDPARTRCRC